VTEATKSSGVLVKVKLEKWPAVRPVLATPARRRSPVLFR
jgi:hypothetical protein